MRKERKDKKRKKNIFDIVFMVNYCFVFDREEIMKIIVFWFFYIFENIMYMFNEI